MSEFFTSDFHFNHDKILVLGNGRPFPDIITMNEFLIDKFNSKVNKDDTTYFLGDFIMRDRTITPEFRNRLNGKIIMILGNHDNPRIQKDMFDWVGKRLILETQYGTILLRHHPNNLENYHPEAHEKLEREPGYTWFFHGHVHDRWVRRDDFINVGVDVRQWEPKTLDELLEVPPNVQPLI